MHAECNAQFQVAEQVLLVATLECLFQVEQLLHRTSQCLRFAYLASSYVLLIPHYCMYIPPLMLICAPVMYSPSVTKKRQIRATSSGRPKRPSGILASSAF